MRHIDRVIAGLLVLVLAAAAAAGQAGSGPKPQLQKPEAAGRQAEGDRGQRVFNQNCARCHNPPEGFSPGISRTLATHMRVRAGLSEADYRALVKYFNP